MQRMTKTSPLVTAALAFMLGVVPPLIAQTTQPATGVTSNATTNAKASKKAAKSSKKAAKSPKNANEAANGSQAASSGKTPADTKAAKNAPTEKTHAATPAPPQKGMVWVNTASGTYHREGSKYYGKTKQGKYMSEADAEKAGYHLAKNEAKP